MTLAYDYPLLGVFWSMLIFFLFVAWWMTVFYVVIDVFRSNDLRGIAKASWLVLVLFLPFIGVMLYLIVRGDRMGDRAIDSAQARYSQGYARVA